MTLPESEVETTGNLTDQYVARDELDNADFSLKATHTHHDVPVGKQKKM
jgi:hypothetical protein